MDLSSEQTIDLIRTQGRNGSISTHWITTYTLQYSSDGSSWENVSSGESGDAHVFTGNSDATSWVEQVLDQPITARYVRLNALTWYSRAAGKWQLVQLQNCSGMDPNFTQTWYRWEIFYQDSP